MRTLSALAYDHGEEYDPSEPIAAELLETLSLVEHAAPVIGDDGAYERARRRRRERHQLSRIPEWFSAQDLISAPWESAEQRLA
jgi:hypothetical protein